jgi:hypothetical protein
LFLEGKLELTGSAVQPGLISYAPIIYGEPLELDWLVAPASPGQQAGTLWLYAVQPAGGSLGAVGKAFVARPFTLAVSGLEGLPTLFLRVGAGALGALGLVLWLPVKKKKPVKIKKAVRP